MEKPLDPTWQILLIAHSSTHIETHTYQSTADKTAIDLANEPMLSHTHTIFVSLEQLFYQLTL